MPSTPLIARDQVAAVFSEWERRFRAEPEGFLTHEEARALDLIQSGNDSADYFLLLADAMFGARV